MANWKRNKSNNLTEREEAFVKHRRADPSAANHVIMQRAGYKGRDRQLAEKARVMLRKPRVAEAVYAPMKLDDLLAQIDMMTDEDLKKRMRAILYGMATREGTSDSDRIKAVDKVLATVPGGYVPMQIDTKNVMTMETLLFAMGGAPADYKPKSAGLLSAKEE